MDTQEKALYQALDQAVDRGDTGEILRLLDRHSPPKSCSCRRKGAEP